MQTMRNASQPHRMRQVDVYHVTSEPRHVLQTHGDPIYSGTVRLSGRLELPPITIPSCAPHEWIIVQAAELSDDRYDGWRNAPCPQPNGVVVGSDGSGPGWERSEHGAPPREFPILNQSPVITHPGNKRYQRGDTIESFRIVATDPDDGDTATVTAVTGLPDGLTWSDGMVSGTVATDAAERSYTVQVTATDGTAEVSRSFTIMIGTATILNNPPQLDPLMNRSFPTGTAIVPFAITATDDDREDTVTITVTGLPDGLMWSRGMVSGTPTMAGTYQIVVVATDGTAADNDTGNFTITINPPPPMPRMTIPGPGGSVATVGHPRDPNLQAPCATIRWAEPESDEYQLVTLRGRILRRLTLTEHRIEYINDCDYEVAYIWSSNNLRRSEATTSRVILSTDGARPALDNPDWRTRWNWSRGLTGAYSTRAGWFVTSTLVRAGAQGFSEFIPSGTIPLTLPGTDLTFQFCTYNNEAFGRALVAAGGSARGFYGYSGEGTPCGSGIGDTVPRPGGP